MESRIPKNTAIWGIRFFSFITEKSLHSHTYFKYNLHNFKNSPMSYLQKTKDLQAMLDQGKDLEALDIFFHDDMRAIEKPSGTVRKGVDAQKAAVHEWLNMVQEFHGGGTKSITANEEDKVSMVESWMEVSFKGAPMSMKMEEIMVYRWEGDKIKEMSFYYHDGQLTAPTENRQEA
jgi:hypothetical protein